MKPVHCDGRGINLFVYVLNNPVNFVDPWGLKGGIFIPIRKWMKKNIGMGDIVGPIVDQIVSIPLTPGAAFLYIMAPKEVGKGSDYIPYVPRSETLEIPLDWWPTNPKYGILRKMFSL